MKEKYAMTPFNRLIQSNGAKKNIKISFRIFYTPLRPSFQIPTHKKRDLDL
jgi:hypothetical protein